MLGMRQKFHSCATMGSNQLWRSILQFYVCTFTFPTRVFTRFSWYIHGIVLKLKTYLVKTQKNKQEYFFFRIDLNLLWHCTIKPIQYRVFNFILYGIWRNISQTRHLSKTGNVENMSSNHIWTNNETVSLTGSDPTEVGRAPLIHFQKIFFKKGFFRLKLARELKFYAWIMI